VEGIWEFWIPCPMLSHTLHIDKKNWGGYRGIMSYVLVTGADGFIGSHLVELLLENNFKVRALSYYNSFNYRGWLSVVPPHSKLEIVSGDVRDPFFCNEICKGVEGIFHLASLIGIPYSYRAPQSYVDTNIGGTINICQAALQNKIKKIIHTSTSEVYGTANYVPIDEKHPLNPQSPYSASKIGADAMAKSYYLSFGLPLVVARPFNTYGPRQSARAIIPTLISQIISGMKQIKVGDLNPTRDLNYVTDTCEGFLSLYNSDKVIGETINIGSNFEISMKEVFQKIKLIMNKDVDFVVDQDRIRPSHSEVQRLWADNTLIKNLTGFNPKISLDDGLAKTIDWFKTWLRNPENMNLINPGTYSV
jgi:NAD dependent epimerase/dehydratase